MATDVDVVAGTRRHQAKVSGYDDETGILTATIATETPVRRYVPREGIVLEILDMAGADLTRVASGMPFLDHHQAYGFDARFGTVEAVRVVGSTLEADIRIFRNERTRALRDALMAGHRIGLSIGFEVASYARDQTTDPPTFRARAWRLLEASVANVQADQHSHTRAKQEMSEVAEIEDDEVQEREAPRADRRRAERDRIDGIRTHGARVGIDAETIAEAIADGRSVREFRVEWASQMIERQSQAGPFPHSAARAGNGETLDNPEFLRRMAPIALDARFRNVRPEGAAADVFAQGERAFCEHVCRMNGISTTGMSDAEVQRRALSTSDMAIIASNLNDLTMRREYAEVPNNVRDLFGRTWVSDFNLKTEALIDWTVMRVGLKGEHGEYRYTYLDESGEQVRVFTLGGIIAITRELSINAMGRIGDMGRHLGRTLAADENTRQVEHIEANSYAGPIMADGAGVFDELRGNVEVMPNEGPTTGASFTERASALWAIRARASQRRGKGNVIIGAAPTEWLVHPFYEETALKIVANVTASEVANANPIGGRLTVRSEPRLTDPGKSWLVTKPDRMDGAVVVGLLGHEAPHTEARQEWSTDNLEFKIRHDFGLGWVEWRSWTRVDHTLTDIVPEPEPEI